MAHRPNGAQAVTLIIGLHAAGGVKTSMSQIDDLTVGEIAASLPGSAQVFEKHGIDFCCSGQISLRESCLARGLNLSSVIEELESSAESEKADPRNWPSAPTSELIDYIVRRHHAYLREQLPRIQALIEKLMVSERYFRRDVLTALPVCFRGMKEELEARLLQQETVLFPVLRDLDRKPQVAKRNWTEGSNPVHLMMVGHDSTAKALSEIRRITSNYRPPDVASKKCRDLYRALSELDRDLHRHFHLENNILFPRAAGHCRTDTASGSLS